MKATEASSDWSAALDLATSQPGFPQVIAWELIDRRRVTMVPPGHWLLVQDDFPFRASLSSSDGASIAHAHSVVAQGRFMAGFPPRRGGADFNLLLERYAPSDQSVQAEIRFLAGAPVIREVNCLGSGTGKSATASDCPTVLLTNGRGGMARMRADLGRIESKYDCVLAANLHPTVPVDRHVFVKRCRAWLRADRFINPLDQYSTICCEPGPPARWRFLANAGDGRTVEILLAVDMLQGRNTTVMRFSAPPVVAGVAASDVRLTIRLDLEDRNFHSETRRNGGADYHFASNCRPLSERIGFEFTPAHDRKLRVFADAGEYHHDAEWSENIPHALEQTRGQADRGDAYSPGWFDLPLSPGGSVTLVLCADESDPPLEEVQAFVETREASKRLITQLSGASSDDPFEQRLALAAHPFVVRRAEGKTVIAGYPWFLDWGRDTLICARGLIAAGLVDTVLQILTTFGRFEQDGTLPNSIHGEDASNRDTSDAPLWFGIVCEELVLPNGESIFDRKVDDRGRTIREVLASIAEGYLTGTPNGIRVDPESGLVRSPSHFTWMDTNHPAGTPRAGYPVEIQVLWIRLLRSLTRIDSNQRARWEEWATRAEAGFLRLFWLEDKGYLADCILASAGQSAASGTVDTALRSNYLFAISLGLVSGEKARRAVSVALKYLVVPGALRSLAPLSVWPPLPIYGYDGQLLNNPHEPYWGRYEGDEDTRRKPAYHNGTAWTWPFPSFCEALVRAWDGHPDAIGAARAYLGSMDRSLAAGCLGHIPEIVDGDVPHAQRGCDAQAWGATEALRVWKWLTRLERERQSGWVPLGHDRDGIVFDLAPERVQIAGTRLRAASHDDAQAS